MKWILSCFLVVLLFSLEPLEKVRIKDQTLWVEYAKTPKQKKRGLSFRKNLAEDQGMLFVFEKPEVCSFWMKDTWIPLSIGFFDEKGILQEIRQMNVVSSRQILQSYISSSPTKYALEVNQGWFKSHGIEIGDVLEVSLSP